MLSHETGSAVETCSPLSPQLRALVMDDDPLFRTLLSAMLKREYSVAVAADGYEGYGKAVTTPPDIAIVDVQMPVWDGLRTVQAFRGNLALKRIPVLILSSDAAQGTMLAAISAGANDYLIKSSFTREEILQKLRSLRERSSASHRQLPSLPASAAVTCGLSDGTERLIPLARSDADRLQATIDSWE